MPKLRLEFSAGRDALPRDPALHVQKGCKFKPKLQNGELLLVLPMVTGRISLYEGQWGQPLTYVLTIVLG